MWTQTRQANAKGNTEKQTGNATAKSLALPNSGATPSGTWQDSQTRWSLNGSVGQSAYFPPGYLRATCANAPRASPSRFPFAHGFFSWATAGTESQHRWNVEPSWNELHHSSMTWGWKSPCGSNTAERITWLQARPQQRLLKLPLPSWNELHHQFHDLGLEIAAAGAILLRESPGCKRDHSKDCWSYHCQGLPQPCGSVLQDTVSTDEGWKATGRTLGTRKCLSVGASAFKTAAGAILLRESPDCKRDHSKDCWSYHCQALPQPCGSVLQDTVSTDEGWKATGRTLGTRKCLSVGASAFKIALMQYCWENHLAASETTAKIAEATIARGYLNRVDRCCKTLSQPTKAGKQLVAR